MVFDNGIATIHDPSEVPEEKRHAATGTLDPPKGANPYEAAAEKAEKAAEEEKKKAYAQKRAEAGQESLEHGDPTQQSSPQQGGQEEHTGLLRPATADETAGKLPQLADIIDGDGGSGGRQASPGEGGKGGKVAAERSKLFARFCRVGPCLGDQA
tara:strand:- start:75 stop:539 length:465 start_codon:yes stop_codon:yes gene_type:complete